MLGVFFYSLRKRQLTPNPAKFSRENTKYSELTHCVHIFLVTVSFQRFSAESCMGESPGMGLTHHS